MLYQYLTGLKHVVFTTIICAVMTLFLLPLNTSFQWTVWLSQIVLIIIFTVSIYIPFWDFGFKDKYYAQSGKKGKDIFRGMKVGFLISIPYFISTVFVVLMKFGIAKWGSYVFAIANSYFYYFIDAMIQKPDPMATGWGNIILFIIMPLFIPLVSGLAYILGIHEISLKEKIVYTQK